MKLSEITMPTMIRQFIADFSVLIQEPDNKADRLIILLHGWGADASDLMDLAPALSARFANAIIAAPDAPHACSANPMGKEWFDLSGDASKIDNGPAQAFPALQKLLETLMAQFSLPPERIALIGFSQGAMMALYTSLRLNAPLGAVVSMAGALLAVGALEKAITARPPILLIHGDADEVVPPQAMTMAETILKSQQISVETMSCAGVGHGIAPEALTRALDFIGEKLDDAKHG